MADALERALSELSVMGAEAEKLGRALSEIRENPEFLNGAMGWLAVQGLASAIEKIYGGCEKVMLAVVKNVDGQAIAAGEGWHRSLLLRMENPFGAARPAVLSPETAAELEKLRSFRHRERNSYGSALIVERVLELAADAVLAPPMLMSDLTRLEAFLEGRTLKL